MKNLFLLYVICGCCVKALSQNIEKEDVLEDLNTLTKAIETYNPALQAYHPEFQRWSRDLMDAVSGDSLTVLAYFTEVSRMCALANEGHFLLGNWDDIVHRGVIENTLAYLPIEVKLYNGKFYVDIDISDEKQLKRGDRITAINGVKTEVILDKLLELTPSDGHIKTYAYRKIEDGFPWLYLFHMEQTDQFDIEYRDAQNSKRSTTVKALLRADQVANYKSYYANTTTQKSKKIDGFYALEFTSDYALLTLPSFDRKQVEAFEVKSKRLYKTIFTALQEKQVEHLIIDLRDNTGGRNAFADAMVPYIVKQSNDDAFLKKTISWEGKEKLYKLPKASKLAFKGRIYVLVNGKTFSAGNTLARYLKEYGNAVVIGTETGTRYEGFAAGSTHYVSLPNSQIEIGIPRYHIVFPKSEKQKTRNRGLLPDYEINRTYQEDFNDVDLHLQQAIALINSK